MKAPPVKKPISEAKRNAEALFETKTVAEIREIENRTRKDIEQKKLQLRQLVGDSYRDLIESADKIVAISKNCQQNLSNVKSIQSGFTSLAHGFSCADDLLKEKRDSLSKYEELYAVGGRVQYLVGTPEMIWGCLDSRAFLEASRRYLRAEQVHALLGSSFSGQLLAKFPLLSHQWPQIEKFKQQILDTVRGVLNSEQSLTTAATADALAAVCLLEDSDSSKALQLLLASRRSWIAGQLAGAVAAAGGDGSFFGMSPTTVAQMIASLTNALQTTISLVGELFLPAGGKAADANCLLQAAAREDDLDSAELLFGGRAGASGTLSGPAAAAGGGGGGGGGGQMTAEAAAWRHSSKVLYDRLCALSSGQVERACVQWVSDVAEECGRHVPRLLRACTSSASLVEVEYAVRGALSTWAHPSRTTKGATLKRNRSTGGATPASTAASSNATAALDSHLQTWETVCEWVLGRPLPVWQETLHAPFVARAKELLDEAFTTAAQSLEAPLAECLRDAAAATPEPAGRIPCSRWPAFGGELSETAAATAPGGGGATGAGSGLGGAPRPWSERLGGARSTKKQTASDKAFRQRVHAMRQLLDEELRGVLASALLLLSASDYVAPLGAGGPGASGTSAAQGHAMNGVKPPGPVGTYAGAAAAAASRAAELEPFVQQRAAELAAALAGRLQAALAGLGTPTARGGAVAAAAVAEQTLVVGGLCSALANEGRMLPALLGAPDLWRHALRPMGSGAGGTGGTGAGGTGVALRARGLSAAAALKAAQANSRLQGVLDRFRACAVDAYRSWAQWAASSLVADLQRAIAADDLLAAVAPPPSWQETVIVSAGGTGGGSDATATAESLLDYDAPAAGDMRFALPVCPSAATLGLVQAACQELRRAGDAAISPEALQVLEWELLGAALHTFIVLLRPGGTLAGRLSERGVLQLLFDVRFLRDVLVGGRPAGRGAVRASDGGGGSATSARQYRAFDPSDPECMAAVSERKREALALEAQLQDRLDPIDWATYEPYLWSNVTRFYHRVAVMFGSLIQLQRMHPEPTGKVQVMQEMNPLNLVAAVPRFQYLPISAPVSAHPSTAAKNRLNAATLSRAAPAKQGPVSSDPAANYSFTDLGTARLGLGGHTEGGSATAAAGAAGGSPAAAAGGGSSASAALSALQARLQGGSLGSLSSFVGDRAAEMTAMAQQRFETFGDYLPTAGGIGSGLLSTFTNVKAKR